VFWIAAIPALVSVGLIVFAVREPARHVDASAKPRLRLADATRLSAAYWTVVAIGSVLTLARFSEAFLVLRAQNVGMAVALVPIVMVVMSAVYAASAYPAGVLSDRFGRTGVLCLGIAFLIAADLILAFAASVPLALVGVALWGLHMGFTQGLLATLVADTAPEDLRGTAFGLFNVAGGLAMLLASVIAGALWDAYGPAASFLAGAAFTAAALIGFTVWRWSAPTAG
jgi:MFS family permease